LVATLPAYLNALTGRVHIVTVNDYLAVTEMLMDGACILRVAWDLSNKGWGHLSARKLRLRHYIRHEQQVGFDHLRDNMATSMADVVQRPFNYCIIDEVDSILIDEARTR